MIYEENPKKFYSIYIILIIYIYIYIYIIEKIKYMIYFLLSDRNTRNELKENILFQLTLRIRNAGRNRALVISRNGEGNRRGAPSCPLIAAGDLMDRALSQRGILSDGGSSRGDRRGRCNKFTDTSSSRKSRGREIAAKRDRASRTGRSFSSAIYGNAREATRTPRVPRDRARWMRADVTRDRSDPPRIGEIDANSRNDLQKEERKKKVRHEYYAPCAYYARNPTNCELFVTTSRLDAFVVYKVPRIFHLLRSR